MHEPYKHTHSLRMTKKHKHHHHHHPHHRHHKHLYHEISKEKKKETIAWWIWALVALIVIGALAAGLGGGLGSGGSSGGGSPAGQSYVSYAYPTTWAGAANSLAGDPPSNVFDGNASTFYSSPEYASQGSAPSAVTLSWSWGASTAQSVNYVSFTPWYNGGTAAYGFPVDFTLACSPDNQTFTTAASWTNFPAPYRGEPIILCLPATCQAVAVQLSVTSLGQDTSGGLALQIAEVQAGYDSRFMTMNYVGPQASSSTVLQVQGVMAGPFNPNMLANWLYDSRGPLVEALPGPCRNLYAPQAIWLGGTTWRTYFGGEDGGECECDHPGCYFYDEIYTALTTDMFETLGAHQLAIGNGSFIDVNNECVLQLSPSDWYMMYTVIGEQTNILNKVCYATSADGVNWTPSEGSTAYYINMAGYPNGWVNADINGGNIVYRDPQSGTYTMYFIDFQHQDAVFLASSTDGINYVYFSQTNWFRIPNDLRAFTYQGQTYFMTVYHQDTSNVWYTLSTDVSTIPEIPVSLFLHYGNEDLYITAAGMVQNGTHLFGVLYGAANVTALDNNEVYAQWLQRKVVFSNQYVTYGVLNSVAFGPNNQLLPLQSDAVTETGVFTIYDTDGSTVLYTSPQVTITSNNLWQYLIL